MVGKTERSTNLPKIVNPNVAMNRKRPTTAPLALFSVAGAARQAMVMMKAMPCPMAPIRNSGRRPSLSTRKKDGIVERT